jgi:gliding motility-associated-like protein
MNCGIVRSDTVAAGWYKYGNEQPYLNTPDINHDSGIVHCSPGWVWWGGTPVASPDGGTWQNVWRIENFAQTIYGLTIGKIYYFRYYYASQGISSYPPGGALQPYAPDVTIIGATGYSNPSSGKLFEWNNYSGSLVATSDSITIICSEGKWDGYIAYDGFYLGANKPDNFLEVTAPDSVTICGTGDASFTVQSAAGLRYQWQSGTGFTWDDVSDGGGVSGSQTNTLLVQNVSTDLNNTQYRCRVTSSCCTGLSAPALLVVAPPPNPVLKINADVPDICGSTSVTITTDSGYKNYLWNNNSNNPSLTVNEPGVYWVEVTDSNNCKGRDSMNILPCEKVFFPNAFTPNNDGINDVFIPTIFGAVANYKLNIYNRFGQLIFQTSDPARGWNGTRSGVRQPGDVYVWICLYRWLSGKKTDEKSGTVVLIR